MLTVERYLLLPTNLLTCITSLVLTWKLFSNWQAEAEELPTILASVQQAIIRAHYQSMIWQCNANLFQLLWLDMCGKSFEP